MNLFFYWVARNRLDFLRGLVVLVFTEPYIYRLATMFLEFYSLEFY